MVDHAPVNIKQELRSMDPYEFEKLIAKLWEIQGYEITVRQRSGDKGIDIEAKMDTPFDQFLAIQVKRYEKENKVNSKEVRNYATLYQQKSSIDLVIIVTSSNFTQEARDLANDLNVKTVDVDDVISMMEGNEEILDEESQEVDFRTNISTKSLPPFVLKEFIPWNSLPQNQIPLPNYILYEFLPVNLLKYTKEELDQDINILDEESQEVDFRTNISTKSLPPFVLKEFIPRNSLPQNQIPLPNYILYEFLPVNLLKYTKKELDQDINTLKNLVPDSVNLENEANDWKAIWDRRTESTSVKTDGPKETNPQPGDYETESISEEDEDGGFLSRLF